MTDDLTVVLLVHNQRRLVDQTLAGVAAQRTTAPFHLVVHDDASTDGTQERLEAFAREHPGPVDLVLQQENQFSRGANNLARLLLDVDTEFVALCEGDDYWTDPDKLQLQVDFLRANPWAAICHHDFTIRNDGGRSDYEATLRRYLASVPWRTDERAPGTRLAVGNFVRTCTAMLRRSALRDEVLRAAHDLRPGDHAIFCAAAENGDVGYLARDMATYRLHGANSWAQLDAAERVERQLGVYWWLGAHLRGPLQHAAQEMLLHQLTSAPVLAERYRPLRALGERAAQLARAGTEVADALEKVLAEQAALTARLAGVTRERDAVRRALDAHAVAG